MGGGADGDGSARAGGRPPPLVRCGCQTRRGLSGETMKPTVRSQIPPQLVIGIELTADRLVAALVDGHGKITAEQRSEIARLTTRSAAAAIAGSILKLASSKERGSNLISTIGLSVEGQVD